MMNKDEIEMVRGSGNIYLDFGRPNADLEQASAILAATIIHILDARKLSTRDTEKLTGVAHSEFSRIRNTQLHRSTPDRNFLASLMQVLRCKLPLENLVFRIVV
jgi:hypothetical protein